MEAIAATVRATVMAGVTVKMEEETKKELATMKDQVNTLKGDVEARKASQSECVIAREPACLNCWL